jgi:hypothetical protein
MSWNFISWMKQNLVAYVQLVFCVALLLLHLFFCTCHIIFILSQALLYLTIYLKNPYSTATCCGRPQWAITVRHMLFSAATPHVV